MAHKKQNAFTNTAPYTKYLYQTSESFNDEQKCGCEQLKKELGVLKDIVFKLEKNFNDSVESHFNREMCFRDAVDLRMREMEEYVRTVMETLEKEVKDCQRRDKQWEEKLEQICPTVLSVTPATITSSKALRSAPATPALNPSTAQPNTSPSGNDNGNPPSTEPETRTIHSTLPFSKEELLEAQADDTAILQLGQTSTTSSPSSPSPESNSAAHRVMTALSRDFPSPPPLHWPTGSKCGNTRVCCTGGSRRGTTSTRSS